MQHATDPLDRLQPARADVLRLLKPAQYIVLGDVVRQTESDFTRVERFDAAHNTCRLDGHCRLKGVTLADLIPPIEAAPGVRGGQPMRFVAGLPRPPDGVVRRPRVPVGGESR
jgi:Rrf2 family nitric oxide-sensitive transcriptional repressor